MILSNLLETKHAVKPNCVLNLPYVKLHHIWSLQLQSSKSRPEILSDTCQKTILVPMCWLCNATFYPLLDCHAKLAFWLSNNECKQIISSFNYIWCWLLSCMRDHSYVLVGGMLCCSLSHSSMGMSCPYRLKLWNTACLCQSYILLCNHDGCISIRYQYHKCFNLILLVL